MPSCKKGDASKNICFFLGSLSQTNVFLKFIYLNINSSGCGCGCVCLCVCVCGLLFLKKMASACFGNKLFLFVSGLFIHIFIFSSQLGEAYET